MEGKSSIIQGLPFMSIMLALLFFISARVISRYKKQARSDTISKSLPNLQFEVKADRPLQEANEQ